MQAVPFGMSNVRLGPGAFSTAAEANRRYLKTLPPTACSIPFRLTANAHQKPTGQFLQRSLALIVGEKQLTAQIISKGFSHRCVRRRVSPNTVYIIY